MADSYIFDANAGDTQAKLARRRALLEAVLGRARRTPKNLGEGIDAAGEDIGAALGLNRVGAQEAAFERGSKETVRSLPEGSLASGDGFSTPGASATSKDGDTNRTDSRVQIASALTPDASGKYSASDAIEHFESGGRNIGQQVIGPGGGYNPSVGKVTGPSSASGLYQMINPTWRSAAAMAGVDTKQFPTAMSAPAGLQKAAQQALFAKEGFGPWAPYNEKLRNFIRSKGGPGAFKNAEADPQKLQAYYGYSGPPADPSQVGPGTAMVGDQPDARVASLAPDSAIATDAMPPAAVGPQGYESMELEGETPAPVSREALAATLAQTEPPQEQGAQLPPDVGPPPQEAYRGDMPPPTTDVAPTFAGGAATFGQEPAETRGIPPGGGQALAEMGPPAIPPEAAPPPVPPVPAVPPSQPVPGGTAVPPPRPAPSQAPVAAQPTRQMLARAMAAAPPVMDGQPEGGMNVRQALEDRARMQGGMGFMPPAAPVPLAAPAGAPAGITPPVPAGATPPPQAAPPAVAANPADVPPATATEAQGQMTSEADAKDAAVVKAADTALRTRQMSDKDRGHVEQLRTEALTRIERRRVEAAAIAKEDRVRKETQDRDERQRVAAEERAAKAQAARDKLDADRIAAREKLEAERQAAADKRQADKIASDEAKDRLANDPVEIAKREEARKRASETAEAEVKFEQGYPAARNTLRDIKKDVRDAINDEGINVALSSGDTLDTIRAKAARGLISQELLSGPGARFMGRHGKLMGGAFLGAMDSLRGLGSAAIIEGEKATQAKARMSTATTVRDYIDAAKDFGAAIDRAIQIADEKAGKKGLKPLPRDDDAPEPTHAKSRSEVRVDQIYNGYRYLGGDKKDERNWRPE